MKKLMNNPWIIAIGSTVIGGVLVSVIVDWFKGVDCLSTLKMVVNFVINALISFLNFDLKVWWVLIAVAFLFMGLFVVSKILDAKGNNQPIPFLSYKKDSILEYTWEWEYRKDFDGKYAITNLHPVCSQCGMRLKQGGHYGMEMECLRCNTTQSWKNDYLTNAQMLIEDNIRRKYLQND